jgi:hypothetical protein
MTALQVLYLYTNKLTGKLQGRGLVIVDTITWDMRIAGDEGGPHRSKTVSCMLLLK